MEKKGQNMSKKLWVVVVLLLSIGSVVAQDTTEQACSDLIASNDEAGRWLCSAIDTIEADPILRDDTRTQVTTEPLAFVAEPTARCDGYMDELLTTMRDNFPTFTDLATLEVERVIKRV